MSRSRKASPPPYFWKVPVPEKDYMTENYRKMKTIAAEGQRRRHEPLKAQFIPGVTKNSKYAHVQSKVGAFLKGQGMPHKGFSDELANRRIEHSQNFSTNNNMNNRSAPQQISSFGGGQRRLSRSSVDIRTQNNRDSSLNQIPLRRQVSVSASIGGPQHQYQHPNNQFRNPEQPSIKILQPNPPDESIYKWKFSDDPPVIKNHISGTFHHPQQQHSHRVEYLPCDGICADEAIVDNTNPDSARSSSSRTSRGCNTEETRIFAEDHAQQPYGYRSLNFGQNQNGPNDDFRTNNVATQSQTSVPKPKGIYTMKKNGVNNGMNDDTMPERPQRFDHKRNQSSQNFDIITNGDMEASMKDLQIRGPGSVINGNSRQNLVKPQSNEIGGGDLPHNLGTVPKYLKQRQEVWRVEEAAKREAEKNAHIPPGYILMSEEKRMESLGALKRNYDGLIAELNRIPIRIDTIRVRNHKVELEKELTRLEETMKTFSRPKIWIKVDG